MRVALFAATAAAFAGGTRVVAFAGCLGDGVEALNAAGIDAYFPILRRVVTLDEALDRGAAAANLADTAEQVFRLML